MISWLFQRDVVETGGPWGDQNQAEWQTKGEREKEKKTFFAKRNEMKTKQTSLQTFN